MAEVPAVSPADPPERQRASEPAPRTARPAASSREAGPGDQVEVGHDQGGPDEPVDDDHRLALLSGLDPAGDDQRRAGAAAYANLQNPLQAAIMATEGLTDLSQLGEKDFHLAHGLNALRQGNPEGAWARPYLDNMARLAWYDQYGRQQGLDLNQTPEDYLNSWKDAFSGGDGNIPLAGAVNQGLNLFGLAGTDTRPFDWRQAVQQAQNGNAVTDPARADSGNGAAGQTTYRVQPGDTLWDIAQRYGTTYQEIAAANGIQNPDLIFPDQEFVIPGANGAAADPAPDGAGFSRPPDGSTGAQPPATPPVQEPGPARPVGDSRPSANGVHFPIVGYSGQVNLHHGSHPGASDLFAARGTPVVSMVPGKVISAGSDGLGGNNVLIQGDDGLQYYYAHLDQPPLVRAGQRVEGGTPLGGVGDTGNAKGTGTHLHLGIGQSIINGGGPSGGAGSNFNAVEYLRQTLAGRP